MSSGAFANDPVRTSPDVETPFRQNEFKLKFQYTLTARFSVSVLIYRQIIRLLISGSVGMVSLETPEPGVFIVVQADVSNSNLRWLHVPATTFTITL